MVLPLLSGQLLAVGQGDGNVRLRLDPQIVLRQEAGEQHPVPVLVGDLVGESVDLLYAGLLIAGLLIETVAKLTPVRAQATPQVLLGRRQRLVRPGIADREHPEGVSRAGLAGTTSRLDDPGKLVADLDR